jgi:hypothetical protein
MRGLADRQGFPADGYTSALRNWVVQVPWVDLQPTAGSALVHPNAIDEALGTAKAYGMSFKLRVTAGIDAPGWVKNLDGPPVTLYDPQAGGDAAAAGTIGRFWTTRFDSAYRDLQRKLAAAYDGKAQIRETVISECQMLYAEPYLRDVGDPRNVSALLSAGFTRAADDACHNREIRDHAVWKRTRSELAFNPYQVVNADGTTGTDEAYTESQINYCRNQLGKRCVVANYSLSETRPSKPNYGALYAKMKAVGPPLEIQTATFAKIGDFQTVLQYAVDLGASGVELPLGYTNWPVDTLQMYADALAANPYSR